MAKSLETCVTSHGHQTTWQYYDNGELNTDRTFNMKEGCKLYQDFHSLPTTVRVRGLSFHFIVNQRIPDSFACPGEKQKKNWKTIDESLLS